MTEKNEALRLADALGNLEATGHCSDSVSLTDRSEAIADAAAAELRRLSAVEAQRDALLGALKKAEENGCANAYATEGDVCGERGCCGVVSYAPHADDCWVTTARAAIKAVEGEKT